MGNTITEQSVWTAYLSIRKARAVARALKAAGYHTATVDRCHNYVVNVANYFEPGDPVARAELLRMICEAAGIQPHKEQYA